MSGGVMAAKRIPYRLQQVRVCDCTLSWDEFFADFHYWPADQLERTIGKLHQFGPSDEVCEAVCRMPTFALAERLYHRALCCGVHFDRTEQELMGHGSSDAAIGARRLWEQFCHRWNYY